MSPRTKKTPLDETNAIYPKHEKPGPTKLRKTNTNYEQVQQSGRNRPHVQSFADFLGEPTHKRFDQMLDQTIYIVKLEVQASDTYGSGFKVHFKDMPNARDTYTAACYGQYVVPQLEALYQATNEGKRISLDSPIKTTIRKAGNTYKFE